MAEEFQTSFIPKKTAEVTSRKRKSSLSILMLGGIVIFVIAILAAGGLFAYERLLERSIVAKKEALERVQEAFEPSLIRELVRLDSRLTEAGRLLGEHIAPSSILSLLEAHTLQSVRFSSFSLSLPEGDAGVRLTLGGVANSFSAVALQSDELGTSEFLKDTLFSDLVVTRTGQVTFTVTALVDPQLLVYEPSTAPPSEAPDLPEDVGAEMFPEAPVEDAAPESEAPPAP